MGEEGRREGVGYTCVCTKESFREREEGEEREWGGGDRHVF